MFQVTTNGDDRLDITFGGKLDSDDMQFALDDLLAKAEGIEHGRMLYRVEDFAMPTIGALLVEFAKFPALFRYIRQFDRAAVLTDKDWLQEACAIEGALIPGLQIKTFDADEADDAERWLAA